MTTHSAGNNTGEIILYEAEDGSTHIDVQMQDETVWLSQKQMAVLFNKDVRTVNEHIRNIFDEEELTEDSVVRKFRITASDGKSYETLHYNLDVIISVGYRVKSKRGTQFRIWATNVLRKHLLQGYTLHEKRLQEKGYAELQQAIDLISTTKDRHDLSAAEATGIVEVITMYMKTWLLLRQYDEEDIAVPKNLHAATYVLTLEDARSAVASLKMELMNHGEASDLFGQERGHSLDSIIGSVYQTFDGKELYETVEEKAAHLLYFVIKDHPFSDGNKRSAVLLFLQFLDKNNMLPVSNNALSDNVLVSLALLIAESDPKQKEVMIRMIMQFLAVEH